MKKNSILKITTILLAGTLSFQYAYSQDLAYDSESDDSDGALSIPAPFTSAIVRHRMAYDAIRDELIIFGGATSDSQSATALDGMWAWDGTTFVTKAPQDLPGARHSFGMVWDAARSEIVLFGGRNGSTQLNDTWTWNGTNWTQKTPIGPLPNSRWNFPMVYDAARQEVVLFGGGVGSSTTNETWVWDGVNWEKKTPATSPAVRYQHRMAYDVARGEVVMYGGRSGGTIYSDTWTWDGTDWTLKTPGSNPPSNTAHTMAYDEARQRVALYGGTYNGSSSGRLKELWEWDGSDWVQRTDIVTPAAVIHSAMAYHAGESRIYLSGGTESNTTMDDVWTLDGDGWSSLTGSNYIFDMRGRSTGIWNYTTIDIPAGVTVKFERNDENTPVVWLASGAVNIEGIVDVDGRTATGAQADDGTGGGARGGPGGFRGGPGGVKSNISGTFLASPGNGPGGGAGGVNSSQDGGAGSYAGAYGNPLVDPLIGGSGGGGEASTTSSNGDNAGGGGGAILIASSLDITVNGSITARGGAGNNSNQGGPGSGGAIVLVADRLLGSGSLDADGPGNEGRVRLEGYERPLASGSVTVPVVGLPYLARDIANRPTLLITSVDGVGLPAVPVGTYAAPDVSISDPAPVDVVVTAQNVPDGVAVVLRMVNRSGGVTEFPNGGDADVLLANGTATIEASIPSGIGSLQAVAVFQDP